MIVRTILRRVFVSMYVRLGDRCYDLNCDQVSVLYYVELPTAIHKGCLFCIFAAIIIRSVLFARLC